MRLEEFLNELSMQNIHQMSLEDWEIEFLRERAKELGVLPLDRLKLENIFNKNKPQKECGGSGVSAVYHCEELGLEMTQSDWRKYFNNPSLSISIYIKRSSKYNGKYTFTFIGVSNRSRKFKTYLGSVSGKELTSKELCELTGLSVHTIRSKLNNQQEINGEFWTLIRKDV